MLQYAFKANELPRCASNATTLNTLSFHCFYLRGLFWSI